MSTKANIEYTNKQVREQLALGRGRRVIIKLDPKFFPKPHNGEIVK